MSNSGNDYFSNIQARLEKAASAALAASKDVYKATVEAPKKASDPVDLLTGGEDPPAASLPAPLLQPKSNSTESVADKALAEKPLSLAKSIEPSIPSEPGPEPTSDQRELERLRKFEAKFTGIEFNDRFGSSLQGLEIKTNPTGGYHHSTFTH